jgi:hypothetical protein
MISCNIPGSYVYAEEYTLKCEESELIELVNSFKLKNPQFKIPDSIGVHDGRRDSSDYWYHVYFYSPQENEIFKTWIRIHERGKTTFALVAINQDLKFGHWKEINHEFDFFENRRQKRIFEKRILQPIKQELSKQNAVKRTYENTNKNCTGSHSGFNNHQGTACPT